MAAFNSLPSHPCSLPPRRAQQQQSVSVPHLSPLPPHPSSTHNARADLVVQGDRRGMRDAKWRGCVLYWVIGSPHDQVQLTLPSLPLSVHLTCAAAAAEYPPLFTSNPSIQQVHRTCRPSPAGWLGMRDAKHAGKWAEAGHWNRHMPAINSLPSLPGSVSLPLAPGVCSTSDNSRVSTTPLHVHLHPPRTCDARAV